MARYDSDMWLPLPGHAFNDNDKPEVVLTAEQWAALVEDSDGSYR